MNVINIASVTLWFVLYHKSIIVKSSFTVLWMLWVLWAFVSWWKYITQYCGSIVYLALWVLWLFWVFCCSVFKSKKLFRNPKHLSIRCYVCCLASVMLWTVLHRKSITVKWTLEAFWELWVLWELRSLGLWLIYITQ